MQGSDGLLKCVMVSPVLLYKYPVVIIAFNVLGN